VPRNDDVIIGGPLNPNDPNNPYKDDWNPSKWRTPNQQFPIGQPMSAPSGGMGGNVQLGQEPIPPFIPKGMGGSVQYGREPIPPFNPNAPSLMPIQFPQGQQMPQVQNGPMDIAAQIKKKMLEKQMGQGNYPNLPYR
jgi:hypothetical protein